MYLEIKSANKGAWRPVGPIDWIFFFNLSCLITQSRASNLFRSQDRILFSSGFCRCKQPYVFSGDWIFSNLFTVTNVLWIVKLFEIAKLRRWKETFKSSLQKWLRLTVKNAGAGILCNAVESKTHGASRVGKMNMLSAIQQRTAYSYLSNKRNPAVILFGKMFQALCIY